ncbi:MAG: amidohydrolase [Planctomycetaceae bacterium]
MQIIDAYTHCGLSKYEPIERVSTAMFAAGVSRAVLVQHLGEFDNSYLAEQVQRRRERYAAVGLVDHTQSDAMSRLRSLAKSGNFRGVRFPAQVLLDAPDLWHAAVELGLILVLYAPDGMGYIIEPMRRFLDMRPHANVVLTHLATPRMEDAPEFAGARTAFRLAEYPGVYWQLSGMKMYCPWPHEPLYPLIENAFAAFGADRILWGSNYPVVGTGLDYRNDLKLLTSGALPIPPVAIPLIAGENAFKLWFPA